MIKEELKELRRKHNRAHPAPWRDCGDLICSGNDGVIIIKHVDEEDVDLIISTRNALGPMLDSLDEQPEAELDSIREDLIKREPIFHRPELGTSRADFEKMIVDDFWEIGASGRRYDRAYVLQELEKRHASPHEDLWETSDFQCRQLAKDVFLVTYALRQHQRRRTRRATIWQRTVEGWKIVYHQGTIVESGDSEIQPAP